MLLSTRRAARVLVGVVLALGLLAAPVVPAAAADEPLLWGAHPNTRVGETKWEALERVRRSAGRKLESVRRFYLWDDDTSFPDSYDRALIADGTTLVISVKPILRTGGAVSWAEIAAADPGDPTYERMRSWARRIRDIGAPIYVTLNHEPEAKTNEARGTSAQYIEAWRQWVRVLRAEGARNARLMWIMTDQSFWLHSSDRRAAAHWYPGDDWVDGIAADAYNWHECRPGIVNGWRSLRDIIEPQRQFWSNHQDEELWLTEYGSAEDPDSPGRKAAWFRDAQALFATPRFAVYDGVMAFEDVPSYPCTWSPDTSGSAEAAWAAWGADPVYAATAPKPVSGGAAYPPVGPPVAGPAIAVVVDDPAALREGAAAIERLRSQGYAVTVHDDGLVDAAAVADADAVLITQNVSQGALGRRLRSAPVPVVLWKPSLADELGLATGSHGTSVRTSTIRVVDAAHPLAGGLSGTVPLTSTPQRLLTATPAAAAEVVATAGGSATWFEFDTGDQMSGLRAPACRIAAPVPADGVDRLTAAGLTMFDTTVRRAVTGCP